MSWRSPGIEHVAVPTHTALGDHFHQLIQISATYRWLSTCKKLTLKSMATAIFSAASLIEISSFSPTARMIGSVSRYSRSVHTISRAKSRE